MGGSLASRPSKRCGGVGGLGQPAGGGGAGLGLGLSVPPSPHPQPTSSFGGGRSQFSPGSGAVAEGWCGVGKGPQASLSVAASREVGWAGTKGKLNREIPFGHTVYKPNIMSVCVSLKVRV